MDLGLRKMDPNSCNNSLCKYWPLYLSFWT